MIPADKLAERFSQESFKQNIIKTAKGLSSEELDQRIDDCDASINEEGNKFLSHAYKEGNTECSSVIFDNARMERNIYLRELAARLNDAGLLVSAIERIRQGIARKGAEFYAKEQRHYALHGSYPERNYSGFADPKTPDVYARLDCFLSFKAEVDFKAEQGRNEGAVQAKHNLG